MDLMPKFTKILQVFMNYSINVKKCPVMVRNYKNHNLMVHLRSYSVLHDKTIAAKINNSIAFKQYGNTYAFQFIGGGIVHKHEVKHISLALSKYNQVLISHASICDWQMKVITNEDCLHFFMSDMQNTIEILQKVFYITMGE